MRSALSFVLPFALVLTFGCGSRDPPSGGQGAKTTNGNLAGRFTAAMAINDVDMRNRSLAQLAQDAAEGGDAEVVRKSLQGMNDVDSRNKAAGASALKLAQVGQVDDAVTVAKTINDIDQRNRVLEKIAKGGSK